MRRDRSLTEKRILFISSKSDILDCETIIGTVEMISIFSTIPYFIELIVD